MFTVTEVLFREFVLGLLLAFGMFLVEKLTEQCARLFARPFRVTAAGRQRSHVMEHFVDLFMAALVSLILSGLVILVAELASQRAPEIETAVSALVKEGWCWWYRKYAPGDTELEKIEIEKEAREAKKGVWVDPAPIPPWVYRKENR